jgi:3-mercaptopyruvate sulfurtransferase SseA
MLIKNRIILLALAVLALVSLACNALIPLPESELTQTLEPVLTPTQGDLPLTDAEVPRVTIEEARAALASDAAILVDVRDPEQYAASHISGAINIWLGEIETNPTSLDLDKDQWIITYCN